jgi:hypothetical protein
MSKVSRGEAYYAGMGQLWCQVTEISDPRPGDVFTIDDKAWIVQDIVGRDSDVIEMLVYNSAFAGAIR